MGSIVSSLFYITAKLTDKELEGARTGKVFLNKRANLFLILLEL